MVRLQGVSAGYNDRTILRDISFHLERGSFHFLTGPSGSGKSTLLRLLTMDLQPTRGSIHLFGQSIVSVSQARAASLRRRIGVVLQDNPMLNHLSVFDNVAVALLVSGSKHSEYRENVVDLLQWVGMGDHLYATPDVLSGGEKQRVGVARAVIVRPELLLADEPTSGLDPQMARRLLRLFIELNKVGTTVVIATHDHQLMRQFKAPRLELHDGHMRIV